MVLVSCRTVTNVFLLSVGVLALVKEPGSEPPCEGPVLADWMSRWSLELQ